MRVVFAFLLFFSFLAMAFFLSMPLIARNISWSEASIAHGLIFFVQVGFALAFCLVPAKPPRPLQRLTSSLRFLIVATIFYGLGGVIVFVGSMVNYDDNMSSAAMERSTYGGYGYDPYSYSSYNLYEAYAREDEVGMAIGVIFIVLAVLLAVGTLAVFLIRNAKKASVQSVPAQ